MKVLIPDDSRGYRDSLSKLLRKEPEIQVSGVAEDAEGTPAAVIAHELRRILDGCPFCDGSYRDHLYVLLAIVAIEPEWQSALRLKLYYDFLRERRWQDLLRLREWNDSADMVLGFALRCAAGRVGIFTMLSPAKPDLPDTPLHYVILPEKEAKSLLLLLPPEKWHPLRFAAPAVR